MIAPVIRGAMCTVMGFTLGVVMKEAANKEAEASLEEREAVTSKVSSHNQQLVDENRQLREEKIELEADNAHLRYQLQEMTQKLLESQAKHERMAKTLAARNAPALTSTSAGASSSSQDEKKADSKRRVPKFF